jgi:hypothetical protein
MGGSRAKNRVLRALFQLQPWDMGVDTASNLFGRCPIVCRRYDCIQMDGYCEDTGYLGAVPHPVGKRGALDGSRAVSDE